ncbi:MFS transporter [Simkania negevensis]|uniref:Major facilitator superfamily (MFS) profile domain-containing protein n=1 Tax=Simkania negevensis (strain ATCC VR-1471 / DSM 27360 / Z) TaxID=331113 RepID=F8L5J6_SIMNZ|nr:MFS transporter [Simkania negevensis]CCB89601.1 hypothetical protein SNE_A17240 [Simkania negevensis Z]
MLKRLFPLYFVIFLGFFGYSLMITIFTPMLLHGSGSVLPHHFPESLRTILLGVALSVYPLGQFLGAPVFGALSDHFGRKRLLVISLSAATIFYALVSFSLHFGNIFWVIFFTFFAGLSEANIAIAQGAIADLTHEKNRGRFFGYIYTSVSFAFIMGPLFGGKLANRELVSWFSYSTPFFTTTLLLLMNLIWTMLAFKETHDKDYSTEKIRYFAAFTNIFSIFSSKNIRIYYFSNFLVYLSIFGFFRCYPMYLTSEFGMGVNELSHFIAWVAVPIVLSNLWLTGFLSRYITPRKAMIISALFMAVFMIVIVIPPEKNALWVTLFLTSTALAFCLPSCATLLSTAVDKRIQGKVMGNNQSMQVAAESISAILSGFIATAIIKLPLILWGIVAVFAALTVIFFINEKQPSSNI